MQRPTKPAKTAAMGLPPIAKTIMLPHENPPIRLPTFPNLERTAVCSFETNMETISSQFGLSVRRYALIRSPGAPFWLDQKVQDTDTSRAMYGYLFDAISTLDTDNPTPYAVGSHAPLGYEGGDYWLYVPCVFDGTSLTTSAMHFHAESNDIEMRYTCTYDDGSQSSFTQTITTGTVILTGAATRSAWVRIDSMKALSGLARLVVFAIAGARALWPAFSPPQANVSLAPYASTRVTALSLLATNVSRVQIKQGTITGARFSSNTPAFWTVLPSHVNGVHPAERYYGAAENGAYLVAPPTQDSEMFRESVLPFITFDSCSSGGAWFTNAVTTYSPVVYFNSDDPFLSLFISEEVSIDETVMALTVDIHLEFRTSSPLFQVGISAIPLETYHAAQLVVAQAGYFYENSTHWKELAMKVARITTSVIPMLFPGSRAARVASAAALLLPRAPARHDMSQRQMVKPQQPPRRRRKRAKAAARTRVRKTRMR